MTERTYWLDLWTAKTWQEFLDAGGTVSGFKESRWTTVQKIKQGDYLLCYLTGVSRWIGVLEVSSPPYQERTVLWKDELYPCRLRVNTVVALTPETAVPILELKDRLSIFQNMKAPIAWTGHLRGSPTRFKAADGKVIVAAVTAARSNPVYRPVDPRRLARRPKPVMSRIGPVTVPEAEKRVAEKQAPYGESTAHTEIQKLLIKLGSDMGLDVWVARNDRGRDIEGLRLADFPRVRKDLPLQFDEVTNRTIQHIDVLWLKGNAIAAAFEIESTTSIYSGLLRMSDLIAMQPNLNIPLYLVAPDERRNQVFTEINRPTFSRLTPPMNQMCRFLPFSGLRERVSQVGSLVRYLKPDFLEELSEACGLDDA